LSCYLQAGKAVFKLHLLTSLARSQRSLTQMLESVAGIITNSKEMAQRQTVAKL
jgi:hypothetical protein